MKRLKKMLALASTAALLTVLLGSPAQAQHYAKNIYLHEWNGVTAAVEVFINKSDYNCCRYEAISDSFRFDSGTSADPDIRYDWAHLRSNGTLVAQTGSGSGWMNIGQQFSTDWWFSHCNSNPTLRAVVRYQIRYNNGAGNIGLWHTNDSDNWVCG